MTGAMGLINQSLDRSRRAWSRRMDQWVRRRGKAVPPLQLAYRQIFILPTRFGWLLALLNGGILLGSLNFNNNLGLFTAFLVSGLILNSMLIAYRNLRGLKIIRTTAVSVFAGQPTELAIQVQNPEQRERPGLEFTLNGQTAEIDLAPASTSEALIPFGTERRGWVEPGRIGIQTLHPTGLFRAWSWIWCSHRILVWPKPADNPPPLPYGHNDQQGQSVQRREDGESFYSLRAWREGDPLHRIAWKASQRHQVLLSREFRAEQSNHLELDFSSTPGRDIEERISILAAWVLQAEQNGLRWTLVTGKRTLGPDQGARFSHQCLNQLAEL